MFLYPFSQSVFRLALFVVGAPPSRDVCFPRGPVASAHSIRPPPVVFAPLLPKVKLNLNNSNLLRIKLLKFSCLAFARITVNHCQEGL